MELDFVYLIIGQSVFILVDILIQAQLKMAEAVKRKKKVRGGHKSYVTSTINSVNELLESYEPAMANQVKRYRVALNERLEILTTLDNEIVELVDEKDIEQEITDSAVFRNAFTKFYWIWKKSCHLMWIHPQISHLIIVI